MTCGVIFDVDGVLVDSYQAHFESWRAMGEECGVSFTEPQFRATFGRTSRDIIRQLWPVDRPVSEEQIAEMDDRKEALYRDIVRADFPAMDGAVELIRALHEAGFKLAVGSSGPPANVRLALQKLDVAELIDATITGFDVTRGKPDPQVFLLAAERIGLQPRQCAVVEDAPAGVEAARAGDMLSIGFASTGRTKDELAAADICVDSLRVLSVDLLAQRISQRAGQ